MKTSKKILIALVAILLIIQLFRIDKTNPEFDKTKDLLAVEQVPAEVTQILKQACYDCHSNESTYPWYTNIAPLSWWISDHIKEGRGHLNFSEWGTFSVKKKKHKLDELLEEVGEGEMPLPSYTWAHSEAKLTPEQREALLKWAKTTMNAM